MKIAIFGASGSVGKEVVKHALSEGYSVRAVARKPEALGMNHEKLELFAADVHNQEAVQQALRDVSGVVICLGSKKLTGRLRTEGTKNIIDAMHIAKIKRLICQSSLGVGESYQNLNWYWKYLMFGILLRSVLRDHELQEELVRNSGLDWTIVRPAAFVNRSEGELLHGFSPEKKDLTLTVARSDIGRFLVEQLTSAIYLRMTPGLSY